MTTTTDATTDPGTAGPTPLDPVVPAGVDPIDGLTVRELDIVCQGLGCDVMAALGDVDKGAGKRWAAMARLAWVWSKRTDPRTKLDPFFDLHAGDLTRLLRMDEPADQDQDQDQENPTEPTRE